MTLHLYLPPKIVFMPLIKQLFALIVFGVLFFTGCIPNKKLIYLQDLAKTNDTFLPYKYEGYKLQVGDIVGVDIKVATDNPLIKEVFTSNQNNAGMMAMRAGGGGGDIYFMTGFLLDDSGYVRLPLIGRVLIKGLNIEEANDTIQHAYDQVLNNAFVSVKIGGIRFTTLGEFNGRGKHAILQNRATIFDAIAQAGDFTNLAKRDKILLLRQYNDGAKIHEINLLDKDIVKSEFYYIWPNDVIYAEPMKIRMLGTGENFLQTFTATVTLLTSTVLIISLFR